MRLERYTWRQGRRSDDPRGRAWSATVLALLPLGQRAVLRACRAASAASTSTSSPSCRSPWVKPAAAWRTRSSVRSSWSAWRACSAFRPACWPASICPSSARRASARLVRFAADVLAGVPSITVGLFVYSLVVTSTKQFSGLAGGLALGILMLPTVTRTTEELLQAGAGAAAGGRTRTRRPELARHGASDTQHRSAGHRRRRHAGRGARRRGDRAALVHRIQQPLLVRLAERARRLAARQHLHLRRLAVRGLAPSGLGRGARAPGPGARC